MGFAHNREGVHESEETGKNRRTVRNRKAEI